MSFVKLDCGILNSTLWVEKDIRDIFITALLMAVPHETKEPCKQLEIRTLNHTGFEVPPGWYGLIESASVGIIRQAMMDTEAGLTALETLGRPEPESRTPDFEGRRLIRVDGGFLILNYQKYRDKDHGAAERMRRYRARKTETKRTDESHDTSVTRNGDVATSTVTQAEAEAEADSSITLVKRAHQLPTDFVVDGEMLNWAINLGLPDIVIQAETEQFRDHHCAKGSTMKDWRAAWRTWMRNTKKWRTGKHETHQRTDNSAIARVRAANDIRRR